LLQDLLDIFADKSGCYAYAFGFTQGAKSTLVVQDAMLGYTGTWETLGLKGGAIYNEHAEGGGIRRRHYVYTELINNFADIVDSGPCDSRAKIIFCQDETRDKPGFSERFRLFRAEDADLQTGCMETT
jgi:hypothetical protein